jgi:hypothetical protein
MIKKTIGVLILFIWMNALSHIIVLPSYLLGKNKEASQLTKIITTNLLSYIYQKQFESPVYYNGIMAKTPNKVDVIIANHISTIDYALLSSILEKFNFDENYFIIKRSSTLLPIGGFLFASDNDIKLSRKWKEDENHIFRELKNITSGTIIIFPEGTRFTEDKQKEAINFSKENNYPIYENTLVPRTKGIWKILSYLHKENKLGNMFDLTLIIEKFIKKSAFMNNILLKDMGKSYVIMRNITLPDTKILYNKDIFKQWFFFMWKQKDNLITNHSNYVYNKLESEYKTSNYILIITTIIVFITLIKKFNWKYLSISFALIYLITFYRCYLRK